MAKAKMARFNDPVLLSMIFVMLGIAGGIVAILLGPMGVRAVIKVCRNASLTEERQLEVEEWQTVKYSFPPEALKATSYSSKTLELADRLEAQWKSGLAMDVYFMFDDAPLEPRSYDYISTISLHQREKIQFLSEHRPIVDEYIELITRPDYSLSALLTDYSEFAYVYPYNNNYQIAFTMRTLLSLHAQNSANNMDFRNANLFCEYLALSSRAQPFDVLGTQFSSNYIFRGCVYTWAIVVSQCNDIQFLHDSLRRQQGIAVYRGLLPREYPLKVLDIIGQIRAYQPYGIFVEFQNKSGRDIYLQMLLAQFEYTEKYKIPNAMDYEIEFLKKDMIKKRIMIHHVLNDSCLSDMFTLDLMCWDSRLNGEAYIYDDLSNVSFDLLILQTAKKLHELEFSDEPLNFQTLEERYLERKPVDAFNKDGAVFRQREDGLFYSVGPDGVDQKGRVYYDPTNGIASPGDVWLRAFE